VYVLLIVVSPFVLFILAIVLSVLLQFTDSDYPFCFFQTLLYIYVITIVLKAIDKIQGLGLLLFQNVNVIGVFNMEVNQPYARIT
jgi:hypothetical protein